MANLNNPNNRIPSGAQFAMTHPNNRTGPSIQFAMTTTNNANNINSNTNNSNNPNNRIPSGPNTPGSQETPTQGIKIFIQRDYSEGTAVKFQTRFPPELEDRIDRQTFEHTIERLNEHFDMAETADCSTYCEGCLACLTAYFIYICTETHYEKHLRKISKFIATQNERIYNPRGIHLTDPILRGLRVIEITIIDAQNCQSPTSTGNSTTTQPRHT